MKAFGNNKLVPFDSLDKTCQTAFCTTLHKYLPGLHEMNEDPVSLSKQCLHFFTLKQTEELNKCWPFGVWLKTQIRKLNPRSDDTFFFCSLLNEYVMNKGDKYNILPQLQTN